MTEIEIEKNVEYLDTLKLPKPLYKEEICDYIERADSMFDKSKYPKELKNELFHCLTEAQVAWYLRERFGTDIDENMRVV